MKFDTIEEATKHFVKYEPLAQSEISYWDEYLNKPKIGEWMLFRHIKDDAISPPILALVIGHTIWDMALVLEYVTEWRAWERNTEILNTHVNLHYPIAENDKVVKHIQFWTDNILAIGHWTSKPNFREIRAAFSHFG